MYAFIDKVLAFIQDSMKARPNIRHLVLFALLILSAFYTVYIFPGKIFVNVMGCDEFLFLDGIHRVFYHQTPHLDFITGLGAFNFWIPGLFQRFAVNEIAAFLYYKLLLSSVIVLILIYVSYTRLSTFFSYLALLLFASIASVPLVGYYRWEYWISDAMIYNRFGWVLFAIAILLYLPHHRSNKVFHFMDAIIVAVLLIFAFYIKITIFVAITAMLGFYMLSGHARKIHTLGIALFVLFVLGIEMAHRGIHLAYLHDLWQMALASGSTEDENLMNFFYNSVFPVVIFVIGWIVLFYNYRCKNYKLILLSVIVLTISCYMAYNNWEKTIVGSLFAVLLVMFSLIGKTSSKRLSKESNIVMVAPLLLLSLPDIYHSAKASYYYHQKMNVINPYYYRLTDSEFDLINDLRMDEGYLGDLPALASGEAVALSLHKIKVAHGWFYKAKQEIYQTMYLYSIIEGAKALKSAMTLHGEGRVITMDFSNPFPTVLNVKPVKNDYLWYHENRNISQEVFMDYNDLFKDADYVMVPLLTSTQMSPKQLLVDLYMDNIREDYELIDENVLWEIWKKRGSVGLTELHEN